MGIVQPSFHYKYMGHLVLYTVRSYCNIHEFTWTSVTCILVVANESPIHVPPIQRACVLKHCHAHINIIRTDPEQSLGHKACQLGCKIARSNLQIVI